MRARDLAAAALAIAVAFAARADAERSAKVDGGAPIRLRRSGGAEGHEAPLIELEAARRTRELVAEKLTAREADLARRVRSLYKIVRAGDLPLWVDVPQRADLARRRAAARRMILRDLDERAQLREELARAAADEARLTAELDAAAWEAARIPSGSLSWPVSGEIVAGFGPYVDRATRAKLVRRGVLLECDRYEDVLSVAAGTVLYAGPLRHLGKVVVVDHGDGLVSVTGLLVATRVSQGYRVDEGVPLGDAAGDRIYLEIRRAGRPVDPEPLLRADD